MSNNETGEGLRPPRKSHLQRAMSWTKLSLIAAAVGTVILIFTQRWLAASEYPASRAEEFLKLLAAFFPYFWITSLAALCGAAVIHWNLSAHREGYTSSRFVALAADLVLITVLVLYV
jgi:hypothetical protein